MTALWAYLIIGALIAGLALAGLRLGEKYGQPNPGARQVVDRLGAPAVIAAIVLFWPMLAWITWGKKR